MKAKNFRKRSAAAASEDSVSYDKSDSEDDQERRLVLKEVKFLQKHREKKSGIPAMPIAAAQAVGASIGSIGGLIRKSKDKIDGDGQKEASVLQDTFDRETAVTAEDPNMLRYIEQELAKKRGKHIDVKNEFGNDVKRAEDDLYEIPEHLRVKRRNSEEKSFTQGTTGMTGIGIVEVQLPMEYKLRNIEETVEAAKKLLQEEKRLMGRASYTTSGYNFQRGKNYAEKQPRTEHPESSRPVESGAEGAAQRPAATDEFMLERFRRRERHRLMRR